MPGSSIVLSAIDAKHQGLRWHGSAALRIGAREDLEVVLQDPTLSPEHACVLEANGIWAIRDLSGGQGTFVNEVRVGTRPQQLQTRDVIRCGALCFVVNISEKEGATSSRASGGYRLRAIANRPWDLAIASLADNDSRQRPERYLLTLLRAGYHFSTSASLDDFLRAILNDVVLALEARSGCFLLADEAGHLQERLLAPPSTEPSSRQRFSRTLSQRCFRQGEALLCQDVSADEELRGAASHARRSASSIICAPLRSPRQRLGVLHLDRGLLQKPFCEEDLLLADAIAAAASAALETAQALARERDMLLASVLALARAVELRDRYTGDHTRRVTDYALLLGDTMGFSEADQEQIRVGTPLHDIGKIGVSDAVLQKPGRLSGAEVEQMRAHTVQGAAILEGLPALRSLVPIVRHHHERWDGDGYPDHLAGCGIHPLARVVAVADAFDAMTSDRPYRSAQPLDWAFAEIRANAGRHFDPSCAEAFIRLRPRIEARRKESGP